MNTCSLSEAKSSLGELACAVLQGRPTVISRGGKLLILKAYEPPDINQFDALIGEGIDSRVKRCFLGWSSAARAQTRS